MYAHPAYDANGQGVQLYLTEEEADEFCREVLELVGSGSTEKAVVRAAGAVRAAADRFEQPRT